MYYYSLLFTICVAFCYVNIASASIYGVDCECFCCITTRPNCTDTHLGYVHLNETVCDLSKCVEKCEEIYPLCESGRGEVHATCTDSTPESSTTSTTEPSSSSSSTTAPTTTTETSSTASTLTPSTTAEPSSTTSTIPPSTTTLPTTSQTITVTAPTVSSTTAVPTTSQTITATVPTTSMTSFESTTTTSQKSIGSAIKSIFQFSHFILFTILLTFLCS